MHTTVVEAITQQARRINTHTRYIYDSVIKYGERLAATMPEGLDACIFVNSGSEANDVARRIAQIVTGNSGALVLEDAYHGCTQATADLSPFRWPNGYRPDHVRTVKPPDLYRGPYGQNHNDPGDAYAEDISRGIRDLKNAGHDLATYLLCTAYCTNGILDAPGGYLPAAAERVRDAGGLVIADEVQFGFGRPGNVFWGFQMFDPDFVPDMIVMGKPIANGMPIGAIVTTQEIMERFRQRQYFFSTFGGNPVATAAGLAVLEVLESEGLQSKAVETGDYILSRLRQLQGTFPCIGRVTGRGLFFGLDIVKDPESKEPDGAKTSLLQNRMRELGVLIGTEGIHDNYLKIRPPMPFGREHGDLMLQALKSALEESI